MARFRGHGHLAYDSGDFETVFLRSVMASAQQNRPRSAFRPEARLIGGVPISVSRIRPILIWSAVGMAVLTPIGASPLLAWRSIVHGASGFAGIVAMALMPVQPLLAAGYLPGCTR
jgi:hypothetical protein